MGQVDYIFKCILEVVILADTDSSPFITVDLKGIRNVNECQFYFTRPTEGHTWRLEKSMDGKNWRTCAEQAKVEVRSPHLAKEIGEARYLRLHIRTWHPALPAYGHPRNNTFYIPLPFPPCLTLPT
mgnify:CR=1 FL=1